MQAHPPNKGPRLALYSFLSLSEQHSRQCSTYSRWRYSPGWALASATICLQVTRFLAVSLHSFIPIFLRSMDTSSSHLILGLPLRLVAYSFPYSIILGLRCLAFFLYAQAIIFFDVLLIRRPIFPQNPHFFLRNTRFLGTYKNFYVFLTVHLSTILVINQLNAQNLLMFIEPCIVVIVEE